MAFAIDEQFERCRAEFLRDALDDAKKWCASPDQLVHGKRNDQYWLTLFSSSSATITASHVHSFLVGFQLTICVEWDKEAVAAQINEFRHEKPTDIKSAISDLATTLSTCIRSKNRGRQSSAASKIAFFTKPHEQVFIWDKFASCSARFRDWGHARTGRPALNRLYLLPNGDHDYPSYWASCAHILNEERTRADFCDAVLKFREYLAQTGGLMGDEIIGNAFAERRLLDKLMFWEGSWLKRTAKTSKASTV